jgi:hypothetical protein
MSGLMSIVSKFTRGARSTTSARPRPHAPAGMHHGPGHVPHAGPGQRRNLSGIAKHGHAGGRSSVEGMARRLLHRAR